MAFEAPRLDDRAFQDIMAEALQLIPYYCPEWTDHNPSDPGITLVELFAWMTDIVLYRLNRVPDKHFIKFMELIGMRLWEAEPAKAPVTFWADGSATEYRDDTSRNGCGDHPHRNRTCDCLYRRYRH